MELPDFIITAELNEMYNASFELETEDKSERIYEWDESADSYYRYTYRHRESKNWIVITVIERSYWHSRAYITYAEGIGDDAYWDNTRLTFDMDDELVTFSVQTCVGRNDDERKEAAWAIAKLIEAKFKGVDVLR